MKHFQFLDAAKDLNDAFVPEYSWPLIALSLLISIIAAFTSFSLAERFSMVASRGERFFWLAGGAVAMGLGVWAMHFIGMLAYELPVSVSYSVGLTGVSILPAVFASVIPLRFIHKNTLTLPGTLVAGTMLGLGIAAMHFIGMAAMEMNGVMYYDPLIFALSVVVAISLAALAISARRLIALVKLDQRGSNFIAAVIMGSAIAGMHYTAMLATYSFPAEVGVNPSAIEPSSLALAIGFAVTVILLIAGSLAAVNKKLLDTKQRAERSEAEMHIFYEHALDSIIVIDKGGVIHKANPATQKVFGYEPSELIGAKITLLMPRSGKGGLTGKMSEFTAKAKNGKEFPIDISVSEVVLDGKELYIGIIRDISDRKAAEKEIAQQQVDLEFLVAERTRQAKVAEQANQMKSSFLANMSHELRTPLNAILGITEMLYEEAEEDGEEYLLEPLKRVNNAGSHLLNIINDILDLSKIEAGKVELHIEPCGVADFVRDIEMTVKPLAAQNDNQFQYEISDDLSEMKVDMTRLKQVIINLVGNACKFTNNGTVTLKVAARPIDGVDCISFEVADTGIGMSKEQLSKLFQEFQQADSSTTKEFGGTGLGLAISKKLVELMKGGIEVSSKEGEGSCFSITIPLDMSDEASESLHLRSMTPSLATKLNGYAIERGSKILVIEDDQDALDLITSQLQKEGYNVIQARSGLDGLCMIHQENPAAMTLDVDLPDISGWDILAAVKADPNSAHIPIILCTMMDKQQKGMLLGAVEHLTKPINKKKLAAILEDHIGESGEGNVLVVEDNSSIRMTMRRNIEKEGYRVREAADGIQALQRIRERVPDLIFLDLMMPEMDGFELLEKLRTNRAWVDIPVIVATALDLSKEQRAELEKVTEYIFERGEQEVEAFAQSLAKSLSERDRNMEAGT